MERDHTNGAGYLISQLHAAVDVITSLSETLRHGKLLPTDDEYKALEAGSQALTSAAGSITEEIKALRKRRTESACRDGQELLSAARSALADLLDSRQLKNRSTFIRNIRLLFCGPEQSGVDSDAVAYRKRLLRERCKRIRALGTTETIMWSLAFPPSKWDPNTLPGPTFEYVVEFMDVNEVQGWPKAISDVLNALAKEQPLQNLHEYQQFVDGKNTTLVGWIPTLMHARGEPECRDG